MRYGDRRGLTAARWALALSLLGCAAGGNAVHAGIGAHNLVVVANPNDADSLAIANRYVELRQVPPGNVIPIAWEPNVRSANEPAFRERFLRPLAAEIERRRLAPQIACIALSSGYPYMVDLRPKLDPKKFPSQATPVLSLTSAVFYGDSLQRDEHDFLSLSPHSYFAPTLPQGTSSQAFAPGPPPTGAEKPLANPRERRLAVALGVTYGRGNSPAEIVRYLERSTAADGSRPEGTVYYMRNDNVRSTVRHGTFSEAIEELQKAGVRGELVGGVSPQGAGNIAGLTTGAVHVRLEQSQCQLLPGCLVDNLTSAGGQLYAQTNPNQQTPISAYMRLGAAGASGTVVEPYAIPAKFPAASLHVHYARGATMAEAFYQAVAAPFQLLIIGDPLCRPWASNPEISVAGSAVERTASGTATLLGLANFSDGRRAKRWELYVDGLYHAASPGGAFSLDTTTMADGWHELRLIVVDDTPLEKQGVWIGNAQVKNGRDAVALQGPTGGRAAYGSSVKIEARSTSSGRIGLWFQGRELGSTQGPKGSVTIDSTLLGRGSVRLFARQEGAPERRSAPLLLTIE